MYLFANSLVLRFFYTMGKKVKTGKTRLDKYYHLAKEQGYRARSAFKLIQLTQRNDIFSKCRALLDLCAAPGGWLQVAQKNMPVASTIIGVDLAPIKPIRGVTTIQADITSQRCRTLLKKELQNQDLDVVLHDGAPNVGTSWTHDAYAQNKLVLHATQLACEFLRQGGTYITKVFRSQDYMSVLWVLEQLFYKVTATKPSSSRDVSAEIFVVCSGFKKPQKIDPKFFDVRYVFVDGESGQQPGLIGAVTSQEPGKQDTSLTVKRSLKDLVKGLSEKNRQGYSVKDAFKETSVVEFFSSSQSPAEFLTSCHKLVFPTDSQEAQKIKEHPLTTEEILACCEDLKVLGVREFATLIKWRARLLKAWQLGVGLEGQTKGDGGSEQVSHALEGYNEDMVKDEIHDDDEEEKEETWQKELEALQKLADRRSLKERRKLREKLKKLQAMREMSLGAFDVVDEDPELFRLTDAQKALDDEDAVLEATGALDNVEKLDVYSGEDSSPSDFESAEDFQQRDRTENDTADSDLNEEEQRLSRMAIDAQVWADLQKARKGEREARRALRRQKETRRQQAFAEWNKELSTATEKLNVAAEKLRPDDDDDEEDDEESDNQLETMRSDGLVVSLDTVPKPYDYDVEDEVNLEKSDAASDERFVDFAESRAQKVQKARWFQQGLFQAAGVSLEDLLREDRKAAGLPTYGEGAFNCEKKEEDYENGIRELSDSELPPIPLTDKQKRKEARKQQLLRTEKRQAAKDSQLRRTGLGVPVDEKDSGNFVVVPRNPVAVKAASMAGFVDSNGQDEDSDGDPDGSRHTDAPFCPKNPDEIAEVQALGSLLLRKRTRMDLIDGAYNRYAFNDDDNLPEWFIEDEEGHYRPELPVTKEMMREYRMKMKEISQRPIRKVLEAAGRKKLRLKKRLERAKKQAESIANSAEHTEASKASSIRKVVNKAIKEEPRSKAYIASRRGGGGTVVRKGPKGGSGQYRVVDRRLKKDKRAMKNIDKKKQKKRRR